MKLLTLHFTGVEDAWNFIIETKKAHVDIENASIEGFFTNPELELARDKYSARVQERPAEVATPTAAAPPTPPPPVAEVPEDGQPVELRGQSGKTYPGKIYTKAAHPATLTSPALICLANSVCAGGTWEHRVNAIYATDNVEQERDRFSQRDDVSHFIVVPEEEWRGTDATDDLIRSYLHH